GTANTHWFLKVDRCHLEDCRFYVPPNLDTQQGQASIWQELDSKQLHLREPPQGPVCKPIAFPLPPLSQDKITFYLRVYEPNGGLYLPLSISTEEAIHRSSKNKTLWLGIYYGTLLGMLLLNLYLFISLREPVQLYYIFYIGSVGLYFFLINGMFFEDFAEVKIRRHLLFNMFALGMTIFWGTCFAKTFLATSQNAKSIDKLLVAIMIAAAGIVLLSPFVRFIILNQVTSILGMLSPVLIIIAGLLCWWRGFRPILFFLIGWTVLCVGGLIYALTYRGTLPYSIPTFYSFQIGSCIEVVILSFALGERLRRLRIERDVIRRTFGKYVSDKICDEILNGRVPLDGEIKEVTVLISDLRDHTRLLESRPPQEIVAITNTYLEAMAQAIGEYQGLVLQYVGDSIEAVFGAPLPVEDHPVLAVNAALAMRQGLLRVNAKLRKNGFPQLRHGIGIHSGKVTAAIIGSPERLSYALSGLTVNLASRIQNLNKQFGTDILVSETTRLLIGDRFPVKSLGNVAIRGSQRAFANF
ncbi:MAG: adenylate/guanylate cyclase domain-containing protein, partial [Desulfobacterales bacterium]